MSKTKIKLQFTHVHSLWNFTQQINVINIEINTRDITLICECSEAEEALATEKYSATRLSHFTPKSFERIAGKAISQSNYEN